MEDLLEYLPLVILYLPTAIFGIIAFYGFIRGMMRGMKKSIVALVNMIISIGVCILLSRLITADVILGIAGNFIDTGIESVSVFLQDMFESSGMVVTEVTINALNAYVEMIVRLLVFFVCLIVVYYVVRFILFIIYLIFFSSRIREYNEDNGKKALVGGVVGLVRGAILGFLVFSQFSTLYCIAAGGMFYNTEEYRSIEVDGQVWEYDECYKALKTSRSFGLGALFDSIAGDDGTALDYLLLDFVASGSYEDLNGNKVTINLREELTGFTGVFAALLDNGVISFSNTDGLVLNYENITDEVITNILASLGDVKLITDVLPTVLVDYLNNNTDFNVDPELLKDLDLANDFAEVANIFVKIFSILDFSSDDIFAGIDWFDLDPEIVDSIIDSISNITLLTKFALPLGVDYLMDMLTSGDNEFLSDFVFDFSSILWNEEIQNLKGLYSLIIQLEWDTLLSDELDIFEDILANEELLQVVDSIIQQIFNSDLIFEITKTALSTFVVAAFDDSELGNEIEINFDDYTKELLKEDVSILLNCIIDGVSLFELFMSDDFDTSDIMNLDVTPLRNMFLGYKDTNNAIVKGFLDLNILECLDFNALMNNVLNSTLDGLVELPYIDDWKEEFGYLFDVIENVQQSGIDLDGLMNSDYSSLSNMSDEACSNLVNSFVDSTLFSTIIVSTLSSMEAFDIPEGIEWYGREGELHALLTASFHLIKLDVLDILLNDGDIFTVLNDLQTEDFDILLNSQILHSMVSTALIDVSEGNDMLIIPDEALTNDGLITKEEIINLVSVLLNLGLDFETLDFNSIKLLTDDNIEGINGSLILSRSVVYMINDTIDGTFDIPDIGNDWHNENQELLKLLYAFQAILGEDATLNDFEDFSLDVSMLLNDSNVVFNSIIINIIVSDVLLSTDIIEIPSSVREYAYNYAVIDKDELVKLCNSISLLNITDLENIDLSTLFNADLSYNDLLDSYILQATVSTFLSSNSLLCDVPEGLKEDGYITKVELVSLLTAIRAIGITDLENTDSFDLTQIMSNSSIILESNIFWITISEMLLNQDGISIVDTVIESAYGVNVINKTELNTLFGILVGLGIDDFADLKLDVLLAYDAEDLLASKILAAIISDAIIASNSINVPSSVMDGDYIQTSELIKLFAGIQALGITDLDNLSLSVSDLMVSSDKFEIILESVILRSSVSSTILSSGLSVVFNYGEEVVIDVTGLDSNKEYILSSSEIISLIESLDILGCEYDGATIDLTTLKGLTDDEVSTLLSSSIMCTILSDLLSAYSTDTFDEEIYSASGLYSEVTLISKENLTNIIATVRAM